MMLLRIYLVIVTLLNLCEAKMKLQIGVASTIDGATITFSGEDNKLVTDKEIILFNITHSNLNTGFRVELGKVPDDIFLEDPTPYEDLFHYFEWPECKRNLRIEKTKIHEVINENVILKVSEETNNTTEPIIMKIVNSYANVENTVTSIWNEHGLPEDDIFYDIKIDLDEYSFKYENRWRNNTLRSKLLPIGDTIHGYLVINPGQTVVFNLTGLKTLILVEVDYMAKLVGNLIGDYDNLYGKYHFYAPTVGNIMKAANLLNEIRTTEFLEIRCFTDAKLKLYDKVTGNIVRVKKTARPFHALGMGKEIVNNMNTNKETN